MLALRVTGSLEPAIGVHKGGQHVGHEQVEFDALVIDGIVSAQVVGRSTASLPFSRSFRSVVFSLVSILATQSVTEFRLDS